jgi:D-hexose-6-phosphate mutarotase
MQGAHLVQWQPRHTEQPVIWLSEDATFKKLKSIRGGIPICWPWFGPHDSNSDFPAHGYARTVNWQIIHTEKKADGVIYIQFKLIDDQRSRSLWPYKANLILNIEMGKTLTVSLTTENTDDKAFVIGEALHTYFEISDINHIKVRGLEGCDYYDKVLDCNAVQQDEITFVAETDRVYMNTETTCIIEDAAFNRNIVISKTGSQSTVVWNPWIDKANDMGDLGPQGWTRMVCVETANALDNVMTLNPGESHTISAQYTIQAR